MTIQAGTFVRLKSGSPYMIVDHVLPMGVYVCVVYNATHGVQTVELREHSLHVCTPEELKTQPPGKKWVPGILSPPPKGVEGDY